MHAAKGTVSINPLSGHRRILSPVVVSSLLSLCVCLSSSEETVLGGYPQLMFLLCGALQPRHLTTVDEEGNSVKVLVRVGQVKFDFSFHFHLLRLSMSSHWLVNRNPSLEFKL